ncbi:hypothetical protein J6P92_03255 [bacterium]|nr:hypothetical protein [bacterium]
MTSLSSIQNSSKVGCCPHGLPQGACPICSGMGGGAKKADFSAKPGEMSWNECAAIGAFLKAQKNAQLQRQQDAQNFAQNAKIFQNNLMNASQKLANIAQFFTQNSPSIIAKPVGFVLNTLIGAPIRFVANIPTALQNIGQKFADISDKLAAIMGELKNSTEKKISESFGNFKKKVKSLFSIFKPLDTDNNEKQIEEVKRTFELKTFIHDLYKRITERKIEQTEDKKAGRQAF